MLTALLASLSACGSGTISYAPVGSGGLPITIPTAPTGVTPIAGNGQVVLSWTLVPGATSYNVYYSTSSGVTIGGTGVTKFPGATSGGAVTGLVNLTKYYFVVTAVNAAGESPISAEVSATPTLPVAPGAPTGVGFQAGNAQVTINWTAVAGATSYNVYYSTSTGVGSGSATNVTNITTVSTTVTPLVNGTPYYFVVVAVNAGGMSQLSTQVTATPLAPVPGVPTISTISGGNTSVTITWAAVAGASTYNVYYATTQGGVGTGGTNKVTGITTLTTTLTGSGTTISAANGTVNAGSIALSNGTTYYFAVTAVSSGLESATSAVASVIPAPPAPPSAPTGVSVVAVAGSAQVTLTWSAVAGATSYNVYYSGSVGGATTASSNKVTGISTLTTTLTGTGTSISASSGTILSGSSTISYGTPYFFVVTAVGVGGESVASSPLVTATIPFLVAPVGFTAVAGNAAVTLSWTAVTNATSYNVYYATTAAAAAIGSANSVTYITTTGTTLTTSSAGSTITASSGAVTLNSAALANGTLFYFVVTAVTPGGESPVSTQLSATPTLPAPSNLVATIVGNSQVKLTWSAMTGALTYNVYYATTSAGAVKTSTNKVTAVTPLTTTLATSGATITATNGTVNGGSVALTSGTTYYFVVTGVGSGAVESVVSNTASATPVGLIGGSIQSKSLGLVGTVTTFAGVAPGSVDATALAARFNDPISVTSDGTNLYVADKNNNTIRKVVIATGVVTTLAGNPGVAGSTDGTGTAALFNNPSGITIDSTNSFLFVTDTYNHTIRQVTVGTGAVTTIAGTALQAGTTDATGAAARFNNPQGIIGTGGYVFVADTLNQTIRQVAVMTGAGTGTVTTLAGGPGLPGYNDATGALARFYNPEGITYSGGYLYVADTLNQNVRKVGALAGVGTGTVTTLAGSGGLSGSTDGTGVMAKFFNPVGITTDGANLYLADSGNSAIRQITLAGSVVTTLAGSGMASAGAIDNATGTSARFFNPQGIINVGTNLFVADSGNSTIRQVVIAGPSAVTTLAGGSGLVGSVDGVGSAARFNLPQGLTTDFVGNFYVLDTQNNTVRKVVISTASVTTIAGSAGVSGSTDNATGTSARFNFPTGITTDGTNLYIADAQNNTIRKISLTAPYAVTTLAGLAGFSGYADATGTAARFNFPQGITTDNTNLYVTDTLNQTIRKIVISTGVVTTLAGTAGSSGTTDGTGAAARFNLPQGITTDSAGANLYLSDTQNNAIRQIAIATGVGTGAVTTFVGSGGAVAGSVNGAGTGAASTARFNFPTGITSDGTNLYVADSGNSAVRQVVISSGTVTTPAGLAGFTGSTDAIGSVARFNFPSGLTTDGVSLYLSDRSNSTIRRIQ